MPRRQHKYHVIYKTTNLLNGRYYVGMHSTSDLDDGYLGSGKRLRYAIRRHGRENFRFEVLEHLPDRESLAKREQEIVTDEMLKDPMCMNLQPGGGGGFANNVHMKKCSDAGHNAMRVKLQTDPDFRKRFGQKSSENMRKKHDAGIIPPPPSWKGKHRCNDTIEKMRSTFMEIKHQQGEQNSQFGTCWITDGTNNKKIRRDDLKLYETMEWRLGRTIV